MRSAASSPRWNASYSVAQAAQQRAQQVGAVDGDALEGERGGAVVRQLVARLVDVDADAGDQRGPGRGVDALGEDAGELAVAEQHVVGPLEADAPRRAGAGPGRRRTRSAAAATASPRRRPAARAAPTTSAPSEPASPRCGPAGRGRRSGARPPRRDPRRRRRRGLARRRARWSRGPPRPPRRTSRPASRGGRGPGAGARSSRSVAHGSSLSQVSASVHPGEGTDVPPTTQASTSTPRPASSRTSTAGSTRPSTPARRRPSRSSTPRAARPPASASRCSSTRARSSSSTSWPGTARRRSGWRRTGPYGDGVVTGYGTVDGRQVCVFSPGLHDLRRLAGRGVRREDHQGDGPRHQDRLPDRRHQRGRRRPHPGGRGLARAVRRDLPPQRARLGRDPPDLA